MFRVSLAKRLNVSLMQDEGQHYYHLFQSLFVTFYLFLLCLIGLIIYVIKFSRSNKDQKESLKLRDFTKAVQLLGGFRPKYPDGAAQANVAIAEAMKNSSKIYLMLINGSSVFRSGSPFFEGLKLSRDKDVKIMFLDPLSKYAKQRAISMRNSMGTDGKVAWDEYILGFLDTKKEVEHLRDSEWGRQNKIGYNLHCSRPFFRLYIFDNEAFIQTYEGGSDGHETPIYHVGNGSESLFALANDLFSFHWEKGFSFDDSESISSLLAVYLCDMHDISSSQQNQDPDALRKKVLENALARFEGAEKHRSQLLK